MREITSSSNAYIKELRSLRSKKHRNTLNRYLIEGSRTVQEALSGAALIESVITCNPDSEVAQLAERRGLDVILVPRPILLTLSDTKTPPDVLACLLKESAQAEPLSGLVIVCDDVQDPKNLGAIIRSADACGASGVVISPASADPYGPKCQRAAMGSMFHLPVTEREPADYVRNFKARGGKVVAGLLEGTSDLGAVQENTAVVVGNEARGVSPELRELADIAYRIPIYGRAESLNAAVAAGIMMYDIARKLRG